MPDILGTIIHLLGKIQEGVIIESDLMRSLDPVLVELLLEDSFLIELLEELCCCIAEDADESNIFISCSALFQKL